MTKFRCTGDIIFDDVPVTPGQICNVQLKPFAETCNFLQYLNPLTPEKPYFFAQIRSLGKLICIYVSMCWFVSICVCVCLYLFLKRFINMTLEFIQKCVEKKYRVAQK